MRAFFSMGPGPARSSARLIALLAFAFLAAPWVSAEEAKPPPEPPSEGRLLPRPQGGFLHLVMEDSRFAINFLDEAFRPEPADVDRAVLRIRRAVTRPESIVLLPGDEPHRLANPRFIRAPWTFHLVVLLFKGEGGDAVESYTLNWVSPAGSPDKEG
ncbi:MAG: hypothetical protein EA425_11910 [Puniceicoccaceae bacterium]|nr:MAG: hypothetical protein EA425_11910 [Puniceicoccaceae bacterium]